MGGKNFTAQDEFANHNRRQKLFKLPRFSIVTENCISNLSLFVALFKRKIGRFERSLLTNSGLVFAGNYI